MAKLTYRGVSYDTEDQPKTGRQHGDGLVYRGHGYDGYEAEKAAEPGKRSFLDRVYRGIRRFR